ncbi:hypothetical Protein YC6258_05748 [Gynuella sunshinyii YC6258]|uniref:Uncharacterized protein n=1 Tax=Gynuella sunshinyii YC6258 TaxID=1445510 RepID=A0A0C5VUF7_9GAMM|nr:hypothetical Protein YC6258_05748 [Gynuella sunshinyii YC6258]
MQSLLRDKTARLMPVVMAPDSFCQEGEVYSISYSPTGIK